MALSGYDLHSDTSGIADPFEDSGVDFLEQTGADWYALALTASLGGKSVHGVTFAPTMETLAKVTPAYAAKYAHGTIKVNDWVSSKPTFCEDKDMQQYCGKDFKGVHTSAGATMSFDTGAWEPSTRTRARNTALLAAIMSSGTGDVQPAREFAEFVSASPVPEEAVTQAIIPVSVLKRECVAIAKPNHAVYSRGTTQKSIVWEDGTMVAEKFSEAAAIDWGRLTTIARYIAEANMRYDPKFTAVAKSVGVPYCLVSGAWAYVVPSDFLPPQTPDYTPPDLTKYSIPTLQGAYDGHLTKLIHSAEVAMAAHDDVGNAEGMHQLMSIVERLRKVKPDRKHVVSVGTELVAEIKHHSLSADKAAALVAKTGTAANAVVMAGQQWAQEEKEVRRMAVEIAVAADKGVVDQEKVNNFSQAWLKPPPWILALNILAKMLGTGATARERLARYRRAITGTSSPWLMPISPTKSVLSCLTPFSISMAKKMAVPTKAPLNLPPLMASVAGLEAREAVSVASDYIKHHLHIYAPQWAKRYEEKSRAYALVGSAVDKKMAVMYSVASIAFAKITISGVLAPFAGYVDMSTPHTTYLYHVAKNYARKRRLNVPNVPATPLTSAASLALALDKQYSPPTSFVEAEAFARAKLEMFAGDLYIAQKPVDIDLPIGDEVEEAIQATATPVTQAIVEEDKEADDDPKALFDVGEGLPEEIKDVNEDESDDDDVTPPDPNAGVDTVATAGDEKDPEEEMMAMMLSMMKTAAIEEPLEARVLRSYTNLDQAEAHAKANGFTSFSAAVASVGQKARFDPEFEYTAKGLAVESENNAEADAEGDAIV